MSKQFILLLILVATASSLLFVKTAYSSVPTPSVPEFTMKLAYSSYAVTTTNPYTGLDETERISNNSIEITIKNQPFNYPDYQLYYSVRAKPHFAENDWTNVSTSILQSDSSYTVIVFSAVSTVMTGETGYDLKKGDQTVFYALPDGSQLDFQVEASVGHIAQRWVPPHWMTPDISGHYVDYVAFDTTSGWSETQTFTIGVQLSPLLSATLIVLLGVASLGLAFYLIKRKQSN
jgi:hypothetical protein